MKINIKQFKKWIQALDSGDFKQAYGELEAPTGGYCCLGVACKVLVSKHKLKFRNDVIFGGAPTDQPSAPEWLKLIDSDFYHKVKELSLIDINDSGKYSFQEIATILELVYIHKILE